MIRRLFKEGMTFGKKEIVQEDNSDRDTRHID